MEDLIKYTILKREEESRRLDLEILSAVEKKSIKDKLEVYDKIINKGKYISRVLKKRHSTGISIRRAAIITLENALIFENPDRNYYTIKRICKRAKTHFSISNDDQSKLISINILHPEKPCNLYEKRGGSISSYKRTISFILKNEWWLIDKKEVKNSFLNIHNEIKHC